MATYSATEHPAAAEAAAAPRVIDWSHASLSVTDCEASAAWYCELFGFEILERIHQYRYGDRHQHRDCDNYCHSDRDDDGDADEHANR
jgi:catechol 2,3-dioxygenase-like lactoylglutathione lyase family enzyme